MLTSAADNVQGPISSRHVGSMLFPIPVQAVAEMSFVVGLGTIGGGGGGGVGFVVGTGVQERGDPSPRFEILKVPLTWAATGTALPLLASTLVFCT